MHPSTFRTTTSGTTPASRAMRLPQVCQLVGASPATVWRWAKHDATFPRPFKVSEAITCWDERELCAWIDSKKAARE